MVRLSKSNSIDEGESNPENCLLVNFTGENNQNITKRTSIKIQRIQSNLVKSTHLPRVQSIVTNEKESINNVKDSEAPNDTRGGSHK